MCDRGGGHVFRCRSVFLVMSSTNARSTPLESPMTTGSPAALSAVPSIVHRLNPLVLRLLRLGVPMGPNVLLTVRGRKTGNPRTFPVAILETGGRQFVFSPFGEVSWVHNLRAAGVATVRRGRRTWAVTAVELDPDEAGPILQGGMAPVLKAPVFGPMIAGWYGIDRDSTAADYSASAHRHPAFELRDAAPSR
jgi:deazaflavin-dependent oxidoreductase (nitroreductase family)